ncbi:MAG: DNA polymerase I [Pseudomonadota bacterium]
MLLLVDGSSYIYRAFHALPDLRTAAGFPTGAIRGVITMLERIVETYQPQHFAVVMDAPGKTFRHDWYKEYKAHRPSMPEDLSVQIPVLLKLIEWHGWPIVQISGVEADDVIGTLALQAKAANEPCVISTGDKDLAQLVQPGVELINTMTNETFDEAKVMEKFGVHPNQIVDYLTLVGDTVDNVPGVPKVGPKTAAKWLAQYGSLDSIIQQADSFPGATGEALRASLEWLPQAKRLVTVVCDIELPIEWQKCMFRIAERELILEEYKRLEFKSLINAYAKAKINIQADARRTAPSVTGEQAEENSKDHASEPDQSAYPRGPREIIRDLQALERWKKHLYEATYTAFDTETTSLDPLAAELIGLSFAVEGFGAAYIPVGHEEVVLARDEVLAVLKPWFESSKHLKICQHAKYDEHVLANYGIEVKGIHGDTLLQSYILTAHLQHGLDHLASRYLGWTLTGYEEICGKGAKQVPFATIPIEIAGAYACDDAESTLLIHQILTEKLEQLPAMNYVYREIELPAHEVLMRMERRGICLDADVLHEQSASLSRRLDALELEAHTLAGREFNLSSPKQIQCVLYDEMKLPVLKRTPKGQPSTDEEVLEELAENYPLPKLLLEHRTFSKLKSTYTDKLPLLMDSAGRVHTNYNQSVAVTGRLSSSEPNLQNIPIRSEEGRKIRQAFVAAPGYTLISADYSQIELRIMAHLSEDPRLLAAFESGDDIHKATAAEIFSVPLDQVTFEQRRYTKAINFGLMYGMSAFGLAVQLGIDRSSAQRYIEQYFQRYTGVATYLAKLKAQAKEQGYVETLFGRRLYLPEINAKGPRRSGAERAAINAPMQGTAADLIKLAMIQVQQWLDTTKIDAFLLLQVHDELVLEAKDLCVQQVVDALPDIMCGVTKLKVPLLVEVGAGNNWDAAH